MARKYPVTVFYATESDERNWMIECNVYPSSPGTYLDPPDPGEVEFGTVREDVPRGSPCQEMTFDAWVTLYSIDDKAITQIEDEAFEAYGDLDFYDDEPDDDDQ